MWLVLLTVFGADGDWDIPRDQPLIMHAAALDRELDGDIPGALELLRAALELAPDEPMIAFDLARIAVEENSDRFDDDVEAFMSLEPDNDDARMLRAYILVRQGERRAAREQLNAVLAASPELGEATRLRDLVIHAGTAAPARFFSAGLRVGVEGDSNVTVTPDSDTGDRGLRIATQGNVTLVPLRGATELTTSLALKYAPHLNDREVLGLFDVASATGLVRVRQKLGDLVLTAQLSGNEIAIDSTREQFMKDLFGDFELRYPSDSFHLAAFGRAGYRDFGVIFNPEEGDPDSFDDRDGARYSVGVLSDWIRGNWTLGARASFEAAQTEGRRQRERGSEVATYLRWRTYPWSAHAGISWALRHFPTAGSQSSRMDNRFTVSLSCSRMLGDHLGAFASVIWIENLSAHDQDRDPSFDYDYRRLLVQVGGLAQW